MGLHDRAPLQNPRRAWWLLTGAGLALGCMGALILVHQPPGSAWMPGCVFHQITGLYCTGCGITRATYAVLQGDLARAWAMNPLAMMAGPIGLFLWIHEGLGRPQRWERVAAGLRDARLWMVVVLVFTVARNLPWPPFAWLAPG